MASTVGHSMAGLAICLAATPKGGVGRLLREDKARIAGYMLLANLPDLDFLAGAVLYGDAEKIHGGVLHGLPFAALVAVALALAIPAASRLRSFLVYFAVIASHDIIDLFTSYRGVGRVETTGAAIFAPFVERKITMPVALFFGPTHGTLDKLVSLHNVAVVAYEVALFSVVIGVIVLIKAGGVLTKADGTPKR